MDVPTRKSTNC